jgi:photosystem II stability/assembly factor-like uncharacterized protein
MAKKSANGSRTSLRQPAVKSGVDVSGGTTVTPGPRKQAPTGKPAVRLAHHKGRAAWFRAREAWPLRDPSFEALAKVRGQSKRQLAPPPGLARWTLVGPTNIGGRCTSLVCHPAQPDTVWIGAAGGGVWKSTDAGATWKESWKAGAPLQIGSLAVDPRIPDVVWCGTGEANMSADSYPGDGLYRSADGGKTWQRVASSAKLTVPSRIGAIAVDPFDSLHVLVGGIGYGRLSVNSDSGGLFETCDGGATWQRLVPVTGAYWCHFIVFDPATKGRAYASITTQGAASGVYRLEDATGWQQMTQGLPASDRMGRASIALAPSNPRTLYAFVADEHSEGADLLLGLFKSSDAGNTWANVAGSHFSKERQIGYGNAIAVHPTDPNHVICGGVDLHLTRDGGKTWKRVTRWNAQRGTVQYAHADHHALLMPAAAPGRVYSANDGGMDLSNDGGMKWQNRSAGLAITMFYDLDIGQSDARVLGGGAQDNGTLVTNAGDPANYFELLGGDGGWMVVDPRDAGHIFASYQYGGMFRFRGGTWKDVSPPFEEAESHGIWMVFIAMDPSDSKCVYTGNHRLYRTRNDGDVWSKASPVFDGSPISAIEVAQANSQVIYVGTENGSFFRTIDGGTNWSGNLRNGMLPGVAVTRIATAPGDANDVCVTVANFGNSHVFRSRNGGVGWKDIDAGRLPDAPHHAVLMRPDKPAELYVCSDAGVHMTSDDGVTWHVLTANLPLAMVVDIVYHVDSKSLVAATYGRSIWRLQLS